MYRLAFRTSNTLLLLINLKYLERSISEPFFFFFFQVFREVEVKGFDASQYEAKQIFYTSKDGTKVPMFIVSKKVWYNL